MKRKILFLTALICTQLAFSQTNTYNEAIKLYNDGEFNAAAKTFDIIFEAYTFQLSNGELYNGACIYALNGEPEKAFRILEYLAEYGGYANEQHITTDTDLVTLHDSPQWQKLLNRIKINNLPLSQKVKTELLKAKKILETDNGKLWGEPIWNDNILALAADNSAYSLTAFAGSEQDTSGVYYAKLPANNLYFVNTTQDYDNQKYATVREDYLSDNSSTIIHELFHLVQQKHRPLGGAPVEYLENYDAREWLRLEFQALRNCLNVIDKHFGKTTQIDEYLQDAFIFRIMRHKGNEKFLQNELELETNEGLANYTGHILSSYPNKYEMAIKELNQREQINSYTRMYVYATGVAYGVIFDYLKIDWRQGLDTVYNFEEIYESKYLKTKLLFDENSIEKSKERNNYAEIHRQETERKEAAERKIAELRRQLVDSPTLSAKLADPYFGRSYDANGLTFVDGAGMAYTTFITGNDAPEGKNFGSFKFSATHLYPEIKGIIETPDGTFIFPLPFRQEGNKIIGETYEITLNDGWSVKQKNDKGDFEIVKEEQ